MNPSSFNSHSPQLNSNSVSPLLITLSNPPSPSLKARTGFLNFEILSSSNSIESTQEQAFTSHRVESRLTPNLVKTKSLQVPILGCPENISAAEGSKSKNYISFPLKCVFLFQIIIIVLLFSFVIYVKTESELAARNEALRVSVEGSMEIMQKSFLAKFKKFYSSSKIFRTIALLNRENFDCKDDRGSVIEGNETLYYYLYGFYVSSSLINSIYILKQSTKYNFTDGTPRITSCGVNKNYFWKIANGTKTKFKYVKSPFPHDNYYVNEPNTLRLITNSSKNYSVPVEDWTSTKGFFHVNDIKLIFHIYYNYNRPSLILSFVTSFSDNTTYVKNNHMVSGLGLDIDFSSTVAELEVYTPHTEDSYTTLYDLSVNPPRAIYATSIDLFKHLARKDDTFSAAGNTSYRKIDEAYMHSLQLCPDLCLTPITKIFGDVVISVTAFDIKHSLKTKIVQTTPKSYYFGAMKKAVYITVIISIIGLFIILALCFLVLLSIHRPIQALMKNMELAAVMKNDKVVPSRSFLSEIQRLNECFDKMNNKLLAARAFMPQSYLVEEDPDEVDEDEGEMEFFSDNFSATESISSHGLCNSKKNYSPDGSESASSNSSISSRTKNISLCAVSTRRIAVLSVNICGFYEMAKDTTAILHTTERYLTEVQSIIGIGQGVVDSYHGDHIVITYNASKRVSLPGMFAVSSALLIRNSLIEIGINCLSLGAALGNAVVGNMGNDVMKRFSIVGKVYSDAIKLEQASNRLERREGHLYGPFGCLVNSAIAAETETTMDSQLVGLIHQHKEQEPIEAYSICQLPKETKNDEWMYQLADRKQQYREYNAVLLKLLEGNLEGCILEFSLLIKKNNDLIENRNVKCTINNDDFKGSANNDIEVIDSHNGISLPLHYKRLKSLISYHHILMQFNSSLSRYFSPQFPEQLSLSSSASPDSKANNANFQGFPHPSTLNPFINNNNLGLASYCL